MNEKDKKHETAAVAEPATAAAPQNTQPTPQNVESDAVRQAKTFVSQPVAPYKSGWQQQLSDTMKKIQNRQPFSYDINGDALYEQYKDKYISQGKQAMEDTIGKASAMTGGYGNSYAVNAGNAAYNEHLGKLNDVIPELYQMAYDRYMNEGDELKAQYALLADREAEDYGRWRDSVSDERYADETAYSRYRDTVEDEQWWAEFGLKESQYKADYAMWATEFLSDTEKSNYEKDLLNDQNALAEAEGAAALGDYSKLANYYDIPIEQVTEALEGSGDVGYTAGDVYVAERNIMNGNYDANDVNAYIAAYGEDAFNELMSRAKTSVGTVPVTPEKEYKPYGDYTSKEFYDKLDGYKTAFYEEQDMGGDGSRALQRAVAFVKSVGTDEAKAEFRNMFGDAAYEEHFGGKKTGDNTWMGFDFESFDGLIPRDWWITAKSVGNKSWDIEGFETYEDYVAAYNAAVAAGWGK